MNLLIRVARRLLLFTLTAIFLGFFSIVGIYFYLAPQIPSIDRLKDVRLQVPLRVYTRDGELIAEFGEKRRIPVRIDEVPLLMVKAFLAAEDDRFFQHPGVDYQGILRAMIELIRTGEKRQGGSTITMQVARNFFLSREKTYLRKLNEIILALKIERELSKKEILELYLNKIYLGQRAYGVGAAAQVYYGHAVDQLTLAQIAMIAGLPKAPSRFNPITNSARALTRRDYVLGRMHKLRFISNTAYAAAKNEPVTARLYTIASEVEAPYVAEMVRTDMIKRFGNAAYTAGYRVYTTLDRKVQEAANGALRTALLDYDRRHGYRGPERRVTLTEDSDPEQWDRWLADSRSTGGLRSGLIIEVADKSAQVYIGGGKIIEIPWEGIAWAAKQLSVNRHGPAPKKAADVLSKGDIVHVREMPEGEWHLAQVPEVGGALVALNPNTGVIIALVGGFDFYQSKFNRVTQALRQPGSGFKPFIYSAALEAGYTPATLINDAPVVFDDPSLERAWRPENYSGRWYGPTRMRVALMKSRNLVSIRLLRGIGIRYAIDYAARFGFDTHRLPKNLSLALGSGVLTPLKMAEGYAVLANGGFHVTPYFIDRILDDRDEALFEAEPALACDQCGKRLEAPEASGVSAQTSNHEGPKPSMNLAPRVITPQNYYLINSMMRDVIRQGTGRRARELGRGDLAGKTGTTNDQRDAWFNGFNQNLVAITWVGFDSYTPLGEKETGGGAALPMWMTFMAEVLAGVPEEPLEQPPGLVTVRIDPKNGLLARADQPDAVFETFRADNVPRRRTESGAIPGDGTQPDSDPRDLTEQLF